MDRPETTVSRISNGPQILCRMCGTVCNHIAGLCPAHRTLDGHNVWPTAADRAYLEWKRTKDRRLVGGFELGEKNG